MGSSRLEVEDPGTVRVSECGQVAGEILVFALGDGVAAEEIDGAAFGGGGEPGACGIFSGTPDCGHCSSGVLQPRASCARSSARPTSRVRRVRPAMTRADSMRQTASMARCGSVADTATDHTSFPNGECKEAADFSMAWIRQLSTRADFVLGSLLGTGWALNSSISKTWRISISESALWGLGQRFDPLDGLFQGH